ADEQESVEPAPGHSSQEEGAEVFQHLDAGQQLVGGGDIHQAATLGNAGVGNAHHASGSYHPAAGEFQVGLGQLQQRVLLQNAVHINAHHIWVLGVVDADVQGIALAAVDFVNDGEFLEGRVSRPVDLPNCLGGQASLDLIVHSLQFVGGYHQF